MSKIKNTTYLRSRNLRTILKAIHKKQPISRTELARVLGVNASTISQILNPLIDKGILKIKANSMSTGGRPSKLLSISPESFYSISIDLSGYVVKLGLVNFALDICESEIVEISPDTLIPDLERIVSAVEEIIDDFEKNGGNILGVCIAVSGVINSAGRVQTSIIEGLENVRIKDFFTSKINKPIFIENDSNLSAIGEFMEIRENIQNLFYIHFGRGIGGGIVFDQDVYKGESGFSGEIGKMIYSSSTFQTVGEFYESIFHKLKNAEVNDETIKDLEQLLFFVILNVRSLLDISHFAIGGRYAAYIPDEVLINVEKKVQEYFYGMETYVIKPTASEDTILKGAAEFAFEKFIENQLIFDSPPSSHKNL